MNNQLIKYFADLKITMLRDGVQRDITEQLDEVNQQFTKLLDDFRTLPPEQQSDESVKREFYQGQADFHFTANKCIVALCEVIDDDEDDIAPGQGDPKPMAVDGASNVAVQTTPPAVDAQNVSQETDAAKSLELPSTSADVRSEPKNDKKPAKSAVPAEKMDEWEDDSGTAKENEPVKLHTLSYKDYRFCLEPILQLPTIVRVSEEALDNIVRALNESARRAATYNACIESETPAIVAILHSLLDRATQVVVYGMARQVEGGGGFVTLNMLASCLLDRAQNILPEEMQLDDFSRERSREPSPTPSVSGASSSRRNRVVCPNCGADHYLHRCDSFKQLTYAQRISVLEFNRLCHNCFMPTHRTNQCPKKGCKRCGNPHNSILQCIQPPPQPQP